MRQRPGFLQAFAVLAMALALTRCSESPPASTDAGIDVSTDTGPSCPTGQTVCGSACADLQSSESNCGACGNACGSGERCVAGACRVDCPTGQVACTLAGDAGTAREVCVLTSTDRANCGMCGRACADGEVCSMGMCTTTCAAGLTTCGTGASRACADLTRDPANCGACGTACAPGQACAGGTCSTSCPQGQTACVGDGGAGYCADLSSSRANCGACGVACASGQLCAASTCVTSCPTGQSVCGETCRDLQTDRDNCGACGRSCGFANATPSCASGACALGACNTGFANCDGAPMNGCEVNTASSLNHCGGCAQRCDGVQNAARVCQGGRCDYTACEMGFGDCDNDRANGCEANLRASVAHCGGCGRACSLAHATPRCDGGACRVQSCEAGWANCDGNDANGCEVNVRASNTNCGGCGRVCGFIIPGLFAACCNGSCSSRASCN
ncbi:MAG: MXAN_6577-like cysteine-rich protein [Polyangiales bacterium]